MGPVESSSKWFAAVCAVLLLAAGVGFFLLRGSGDDADDTATNSLTPAEQLACEADRRLLVDAEDQFVASYGDGSWTDVDGLVLTGVLPQPASLHTVRGSEPSDPPTMEMEEGTVALYDEYEVVPLVGSPCP